MSMLFHGNNIAAKLGLAGNFPRRLPGYRARLLFITTRLGVAKKR